MGGNNGTVQFRRIDRAGNASFEDGKGSAFFATGSCQLFGKKGLIASMMGNLKAMTIEQKKNGE